MNVYIETYGCRMNICDSEILLSILAVKGFNQCSRMEEADVIILNCCSVREIGHEKTFSRLEQIAEKELQSRTIVICGCFATQLDRTLFDKYPFVDIIIGPDQYRSLPDLISDKKRHVVLNESCLDEMYADIVPLRTIEDKTTAAITIMKGCNQYCSYCIEPYTRGKEHSRDMKSILHECRNIADQGYRELTFVGHIIDRYAYGFADLLEQAAELCPELRIKFLSSHPITFSDDILNVMKRYSNIMHVVHLPVQSGSNSVLRRMHRGYTVEQYKERYKIVKREIPDISIVTDIMVGFCGETEDDFQQTLSLIRELRFDDINIFRFSMRNGTAAARQFRDDVPESVKDERYKAIIEARDVIKEAAYKADIGRTIPVIVEGRWPAERSFLFGRDHRLRTILFKSEDNLPINADAQVLINEVTPSVLIGSVV